ncbi:MAG TPA: Fe-S cluster assembly protein SufD [Thermoanaerobaculia bacterium]|nr:Fe-S cluster assembly protein SufD [Thermoanaerobaculia bacterium]
MKRASAAGTVPKEVLDACAVPEAGARLVFVDGFYTPELSAHASDMRRYDGPERRVLDRTSGFRSSTAAEVFTRRSSDVTVMPLAQALSARPAALEPYLTRVASFEQNVFAALNTVHLRDGAVVIVPPDAACDKPIHLLHVATQPGTVAYPRCVVVAAQGSRCTVIEEYVGLAGEPYFTNAVTEIVVSASAQLRHIKLQREAAHGFHIATCSVEVANAASFASQTVTLGARLSRYELNVALGEGAGADIDGLALISGRQLADTHTLIDHAQPNGRSAQLHKTIVDGAAHAVFNGKIHVRPGAQLTDSAQQSRNLLLSDKATVDTKPQLEIFADDVKCAHGATVGQLDAEQLFYLRSRGLPDRAARNLLTYAFGASVIERIPVRSVVARLERAVMARTGATA